MLRPLLHAPDDFLYADYSDCSGWKADVNIRVNGIDLRNAFARRSPLTFSFGDGDCVDSTSDYPDTRDYQLDYLLERLGVPDLVLDNTSHTAKCVSRGHPIGWGLMIRNLYFARHAIFEIGDDANHVRFDIKDAWDGNPYNNHIDQITLWDRNKRYDIPCDKGYALPYVEELIATVEVATQALSNGDDEQAMMVFKDIEQIKKDIKNMLPPYSVMELTNP